MMTVVGLAVCGLQGQLLVILLVVVLLLMKLELVAGGTDISCTCESADNCSDLTDGLYNITIGNMSSSVRVNCTYSDEDSRCYSSNEIAAAVLVPLFLEALIIGGVIAAILLWKWRRKLITSWPALKTYVEHALHNPTYDAEDYPTSPSTPSAMADNDNAGPSDLYEEILEERLESKDKATDPPITSCYSYVTPELPPTPPEGELQMEPPPTRSMTVTPDSLTGPHKTHQAQDKNLPGAPVAAYAVSSIAVQNKRTSKSFSSEENRATSENASRHFSEGFKVPRHYRKKKPKPPPMPKQLRELTVMKTKELTQSKGGGNDQQKFSFSVTDPEREKYSKLNPKTQYMGLEPHIGSNGKGKKSKKAAEVTGATKELYSHLKH